jgi:hypothetical protein
VSKEGYFRKDGEHFPCLYSIKSGFSWKTTKRICLWIESPGRKTGPGFSLPVVSRLERGNWHLNGGKKKQKKERVYLSPDYRGNALPGNTHLRQPLGQPLAVRAAFIAFPGGRKRERHYPY